MYFLALALQASADGLTLEEIITDIPHDFAALVAYLIVGAMVFTTWYGSRKSVVERYSEPPSVES